MNKRAFTLIEVIISLAILAIGVSAVLDSMANDAIIPYERRIRYRGVELAEIKLHEIEIDIAENGFPLDDVEKKGEFEEEELVKYRWIDRRKKIELPDDIALLSKFFLGSGNDDENSQSNLSGMMGMAGSLLQMVKDVFEKSIREIEVEIYWYNGEEIEENKENFILTTHLIDFNQLRLLPNLSNLLGGSSSSMKNINKTNRTNSGRKKK